MNKNFNAITDPWIPTVYGGGACKMSLMDVVSKEGVAISGAFIEKISILRLLTAIVSDACQFQDEDDLQDQVEAETVRDTVAKYLTDRIDKFNLWDEKNPFLQVSALIIPDNADPFPTQLLDIHATSGGGQGLITQQQRSKIEDSASLLLAMLSYLSFAPNGKGKFNNNITAMESAKAKHTYYESFGVDSFGKSIFKVFDTTGTKHLSWAGQCLGRSPGYQHHFLDLGDAVATALAMCPTLDEGVFGELPWNMKMPREDSQQLRGMLGELVPMTRFIKLIDLESMWVTGGVPKKFIPDTCTRKVVTPKEGPTVEYTLTLKDADVWAVLPEAAATLLTEHGSMAVARAKKRAYLQSNPGLAWVMGGVLAKESSGEAYAVPESAMISLSVQRVSVPQSMQEANDICAALVSMVEKLGNAEVAYKKSLGIDKGPRGSTNNSRQNAAHYISENLLDLVSIGIDGVGSFIKPHLERFLHESCSPGTPKSLRVYANVLGNLHKNWSKI